MRKVKTDENCSDIMCAINEFAEKYLIGFTTIGDTLSVAFVKN